MVCRFLLLLCLWVSYTTTSYFFSFGFEKLHFIVRLFWRPWQLSGFYVAFSLPILYRHRSSVFYYFTFSVYMLNYSIPSFILYNVRSNFIMYMNGYFLQMSSWFYYKSSQFYFFTMCLCMYNVEELGNKIFTLLF